MTRHLPSLTLIAALMLAACGGAGSGGAAGTLRTDLAGSWQLVEGAGPDGPIPRVGDLPVTLDVEQVEDAIAGTAACNSYGGQFALDGDRITVTELFSTEMACFPAEVMEAEQAYLTALQQVRTVALQGDRLVLAGDGVELTYDRLPPVAAEALVGTTWVLDTLIEGETASTVPEPGRPIPLELAEDGTFAASTGCNTLGGDFVADGDRLELSSLSITDAACPDFEDLQDHILAVLEGEVSIDITGDRMTLTAPDGLGLSYRGG